MNQSREILLESGTNELEIVEFEVGGNTFGINVIKVREILNPVKITAVPQAHRYVEGIIELRGEVLPVVNVAFALGLAPSYKPLQEKLIVAEFNQQKIVFHVHNVTQIHRVSWQQIEKPSELYQGLENQITGIVKHNEEMILLLDFEKILADINPNSGINILKVQTLGEREQSDKRIVVVEDSPLLRRLLKDTLTAAGFQKLEFFENGLETLRYLEKLASETADITKHVQLVVTDIEMPQMDGHHLTKRMKQDKILSKLPVIIFSSLITDDLRHKGKLVGADAQISKPEIRELITMIDRYIL
ncbi:MAG: chemotaxis protein [Bacillus sp. (in: firmicutes)]